jgi:hypothetical protein
MYTFCVSLNDAFRVHWYLAVTQQFEATLCLLITSNYNVIKRWALYAEVH